MKKLVFTFVHKIYRTVFPSKTQGVIGYTTDLNIELDAAELIYVGRY